MGWVGEVWVLQQGWEADPSNAQGAQNCAENCAVTSVHRPRGYIPQIAGFGGDWGLNAQYSPGWEGWEHGGSWMARQISH